MFHTLFSNIHYGCLTYRNPDSIYESHYHCNPSVLVSGARIRLFFQSQHLNYHRNLHRQVYLRLRWIIYCNPPKKCLTTTSHNPQIRLPPISRSGNCTPCPHTSQERPALLQPRMTSRSITSKGTSAADNPPTKRNLHHERGIVYLVVGDLTLRLRPDDVLSNCNGGWNGKRDLDGYSGQLKGHSGRVLSFRFANMLGNRYNRRSATWPGQNNLPEGNCILELRGRMDRRSITRLVHRWVWRTLELLQDLWHARLA
jgi:hypothetical protein